MAVALITLPTCLLLLSLVAAFASAEYHVPKPERTPHHHVPKHAYKPPHVPKPKYKPPHVSKPYVPKPKLTVGVEGLILCKSGYHSYPLQGAKAKVVCPVVDLYGHKKAPVTYTSHPTNSKGYFLFTLYGLSDKVKNISACKVKLAGSSNPHCNVATNVNKGKTGAPLQRNYKFIPNKHMNLYTVGPFFYAGHVAPKPGY